ncbi:MAG: hypothetical protein VX642_13550, partial [Bdellovibrionota bacterium]|nr:hypothetical protein [Bdellovibrionota bacterium]
GYSEVSLELLESGVEDIYVSYHGDGAIFKMKDGRLLTDKVYSHSSAINVIEEYDKLHFIDGKLSAIQIGEEIFGFRYINGFESYGKLINTALKLVNKDVEVDKVIVDYHCRIVSFKEGGYYAKVPVDYTKFKEVYSSKKLRQIQKTANKCYLLTDDNEMIIYSDGDLETRGNHSFSGNVLSGVVQINLSGGEIEVTKVNGDKILLPD